MRLRLHLAPTLCSLVLVHGLAGPVLAQVEGRIDGETLRNGQLVRKLLAGRSSSLATSAGPDPDTVYIGKSATNHTAPDNYWNIYVGTYRPGVNDPNNAVWD